MRPLPRIIEWAIVLSLIGGAVLYWETSRDRMVTIARGIHLSYDGGTWDLLDGRHTPELKGGYTVAKKLSGVQLHAGNAVIGRETAGRFFILPLDKGDYLDTTWFATESEWRAACVARGIASPTLEPPSSKGW